MSDVDESHSSSSISSLTSRQASDACDERHDEPERRAVIARMMEENREGPGMKVIAVMVQRYEALPEGLWDLNSISDMGAGRGLLYAQGLTLPVYESIIGNNRFTIVDMAIDVNVSAQLILPPRLRKLVLLADNHDHPLAFPPTLQELYMRCEYPHPLVLPVGLRKLVLDPNYDLPLTFPAGSELEEL